jgi:protein tyrosine phosphatase (PTP) superfamily phosphohydrolase (DUF442 family)
MAPWTNALFIDHAALRLTWRNWGVVEEGRLYRSNHPLPFQLRAAVRRHGIRTLLNLRGHRQSCGADALSRREASRLGLVHADAPFESRGAPHRDRIERLAAMLPDLPEPILIHCKSGADRTGLIAAIWLLLQGHSPEEATLQLTWRHGHVSAARTGILDAFIAEYAKAWPKPFMAWLREDYDEARLRTNFRSRGWANLLTDGVLRRE